jgi:hypothetical protein
MGSSLLTEPDATVAANKWSSGFHMEDVMTEFSSSISIRRSLVKTLPFSTTHALSFVAFALAVAIFLFLASKAPGMSPDELASRLSALP